MFSLIISIISIALVAALAAATVYFGGAAFNKGSAGADASTFINAGQQVSGAFTLAAADGHTVTTVENLSATPAIDQTKGEVYLAQIPSYKGTPFTVSTAVGETLYSTITLDSADVCKEINKRANGSTGNVVADVTDVEGLYGCVTADKKAFYKVK
jgi:hypothetical protein